MEIAGGAYREICYIPTWDAVFGSGVRAAYALADVCASVGLHSYLSTPEMHLLDRLSTTNITMTLHARTTPIVFVYFHPLAQPYIAPSSDILKVEPAIRVQGEAVLRFGFLEGEAIVSAERAVYDPQTCKSPALFRTNGSTAAELAIVLNEEELVALTTERDLAEAAKHLLRIDNADLIVVKQGFKGALVVEKGGRCTRVPAYFSDRVFKIGTGDVFSALFAYHWAEQKLNATLAADLASRSVAVYCNAGVLPIPTQLPELNPIVPSQHGSIFLMGSTDTIGRRYTLEEARFVLKSLGATVSCPALGDEASVPASAVLVVLDGIDRTSLTPVEEIGASGTSVVALIQSKTDDKTMFSNPTLITFTDDFTSAIYFAAWAAMTTKSVCAP